MLNSHPFYRLATMTLDEKVRYGMIALGGASVVFTALGLSVTPLAAMGGAGSG